VLYLQYQEDSDVEALVNKLLAILDKPEKALLLRDVRWGSIFSPESVSPNPSHPPFHPPFRKAKIRESVPPDFLSGHRLTSSSFVLFEESCTKYFIPSS